MPKRQFCDITTFFHPLPAAVNLWVRSPRLSLHRFWYSPVGWVQMPEAA